MNNTTPNTLDFSKFIGKSALVETTDGHYFGKFGKFKGNYALYEGEFVKKIIVPENIIKFFCEDTRYAPILTVPKKKKKDREKNDDDDDTATASNSNNINLVPSLQIFNPVGASAVNHRTSDISESFSILLRDRLKSKFFNKLDEEIVNNQNEFTMTSNEIIRRDLTTEKLRSKPTTLVPINGDNPDEMKYRLGTHIHMKKRGSNGYSHVVFHSNRSTGTDHTHTRWGGWGTRAIAKSNRELGRDGGVRKSGGKLGAASRDAITAQKQKAGKRKVTGPFVNTGNSGALKPTLGSFRQARKRKSLKTNLYRRIKRKRSL